MQPTVRFSGKVLRVRYEDLVTRPESAVLAICNFSSLEFNEQMLSVGWINTTTGKAGTGEQGISKSAVGKWQQQLSSGDIAVSQQIARAELQDNAYQRMPIPWPILSFAPFNLGAQQL